MTNTESYVRRHIHNVQLRMYQLIHYLTNRAETHDASKLVEPEKSKWEAMDSEPRYKYGSEEYARKLNKWKDLLDRHYKHNSHHPEFYELDISKMDLLDLLEMLCDWIAYRDEISKSDVDSIIEPQIDRFKIKGDLPDILKNTIKRYLTNDPLPSSRPRTLYDVDLSDIDLSDINSSDKS